MSAGGSSGFARAIDLLSTIAALLAAFYWFPPLNAQTKPWATTHIIQGFGVEHLTLVMLIWQALLIIAIFALVRSLLGLIFSVVGLSFALSILNFFRKD